MIGSSIMRSCGAFCACLTGSHQTRRSYTTQKPTTVLIYSYWFKPPEKMYGRFKTVETISAQRLRDARARRITGAESGIADRIVRDPSVIEEGLSITDRGKQTLSGAIDLFGIDRDNTPVIIEIKRSQPHHQQCYNPKPASSTPVPAHGACEGSQVSVMSTFKCRIKPR